MRPNATIPISLRFPLTSFLLVVIGAIPAWAVAPPRTSPLDAAVRPPVWLLESPMPGSGPSAPQAGAAVNAFLADAGGAWDTPIDRRTGMALLFQGSGLPMVPGAGNRLAPADLPPGSLDADGRPTLEGLEPLVRAFMERHRALFLPGRGELVLNPNRSAVLEEGRIATVDFDWVVDGVRVAGGARAFVRINNGNLVQAGTRLLGNVTVPTVPTLKAAEALGAALAHAGLTGDGEDVVEPGRLLILPVSPGWSPAAGEQNWTGSVGSGVSYRLVWEVAFRQIGSIPLWTSRVDAHTGEVVEFFDANLYAGQVTGGVYPRTVVDPETVWPFPFVSVEAGGGTVVTDVNGRFPYSSGELHSGLDGRYFNTSCQGCATPAQPDVTRKLGSGLLRFGTGGTDSTGNGASSKADRNAFYHLNIVRLVAKKWLSIGWLDSTVQANVNINDSCNAFYDGTVNFYRSSATCNNTGEISDVMQHEWGHGLDSNTNSGDGATGEGTADAVAVHVTHSPLIGPHFRKDGSPVRNLDKTTTSKGLMTRTNASTKCPAGTGPLGLEVHCEGEIYGQATWDLAMALVAKYGANTGWRESERIFFASLPQSDIYLPNQSGSIYDAYLATDDDDGNLTNGTPNGGEIYSAFAAHEIAGAQRTSSAHCARPAQPVVTATPGCDQITLSWPGVAGATQYRVQKHWQTGPSPYLNVATIAGTSYTDTEVTSGVTYHYVVQAVNASGCESSINADVAASPTPRPRLDASSVVADDTPACNRSGTIDPGESVDLTVTLENAGPSAASGIGDTLTSGTPGVSVSAATGSYPGLAPGASAAGSPPFRIAIASSVACGAPIDLTLQASAQSSCALEPNALRLETGTRAPVRFYDDFEANLGWTHDAASSTASTGAWTRGDPQPTNYQPGDDVTAAGTNCWHTAPNSGGADGTDDVDGGQVVLLSPVMDLTGLSTARLTYWRWFGQRDFGDDPNGDFFKLEVSSNGGSSWTLIEGLGDNVSAAAWTQKEFAVESFVPLTNAMRFRVRVSDGVITGDSGDLIEGAIDEFRITDLTCDLTPPCFTPPTFAGLASAAPGADCGETDLGWAAASSNCQNATITYSVYRSATAGFAPSPANRIASGVTGLSFHDTLLSPGVTYHYVVRAFDSRSGEDANLIRRSVIASTAADDVDPIFSGVSSSSSGASCGETVLQWAAAAESCSTPVIYRVYRSTSASFTPSPASLVAETTTLGYVDAALIPNASYTYVVRARDGAGNEETNLSRFTVVARVLPRTVSHQDFESGAGGWSVGTPNDSTTGRWELGDPAGTGAQPEDDATTTPGTICWATGLTGGAVGDNDVDDGTTTLLTPVIDLTGIADPTIRYQRWYSNDQGSNPGTDTFIVQVSNDGGTNWTEFDSTTASTNAWATREVAVAPRIAVTSNMRFRFQAQDLAGSGSVVEAAIDEFDAVEPAGGCSSCSAPSPVGTILLSRAGADVLLDWTADPVSATRYVVYRVSGPAFDQPLRIGSSTAKSFTHNQAAQVPEAIYYFVAAVNACGQESPFDTEP